MRKGILPTVAALFFAAAFSAAGRQAGGTRAYRVYPPDKDWALEIDLSGFTVFMEGAGDRPGAYDLIAARSRGDKPLFASGLLDISIAPAQIDGRGASLADLLDARQRSFKKSGGGGFKMSEYHHIPVARHSGSSDFSTLTTFPPGASASPLAVVETYRHPHQTLEAYLIRDDRWIVISLTAESLRADDERAFYALLDSVKLVDAASLSTSFDYYARGRSYFITGEFQKAVAPFGAALAIEQKGRQLDVQHWRDLVEMAAISYGNTGDVARAKELFEYGIAADPDYPAFHLWMARYHTSRGDLDNAIASLQKAFAAQVKDPQWAASSTIQQRALMRQLPDPLTDPTFKRFTKDDRFRKAVKALKK